jgi:hypothetical protein
VDTNLLVYALDRREPEKRERARAVLRRVGGAGTAALPAQVLSGEKSPGVTAYGVLKLRLSAGSYTWKFLPVAGETFTDSGTGQCH